MAAASSSSSPPTSSDEFNQLTLLGRTLGPEIVQHFSHNPYFCASKTTALRIFRDILSCVQEFKMLYRVTTWGETSVKKLVIFGILPLTFGGAKKSSSNSEESTTATATTTNTNSTTPSSPNENSPTTTSGNTQQNALMQLAAARMATSAVALAGAQAAASLLAAPTSIHIGVPVQIWLGINYPVEAPQCYVVPGGEANETLVANHPIVDRQGLCYAPLLASWNPQESAIVPLLKQFQRIFGVIPPLWIDDRPPAASIQQQQGSSPHLVSNQSFGNNNSPGAGAAGEGNTPQVSNSSFGSPMSNSSFSNFVGGGGDNNDESSTCVVCLSEDKDTVFVPCGHFACCQTCSAALTTCPVCRAQIRLRQRIFS